MVDETLEVVTAASRYKKLAEKRSPYERRAEEVSELTIPTLFPKTGDNAYTTFETAYQGMGARGVNNLASKLLLALFPPNAPFFRLTIEPSVKQELDEQEGLAEEIDLALAEAEKTMQRATEASTLRIAIFETLKHLLITGNMLVYLDPNTGNPRVFSLRQYVVARGADDLPYEIVVCEKVSARTLPEQASLLLDNIEDSDEDIDLYTHIKLIDERWQVQQEVNGQVIPGTDGSYPKDASPWIALRATRVDGEDYGRSYLEEYAGDLRSLEGLSQSVVEAAAAAAEVKFLVSPNGITRIDDLLETENGGFVVGEANDVVALQLEKFADLRIADAAIRRIEERLSMAFLMNTSVQRDAERVTAEEIRFVAGELEDALGGFYSNLAVELQLPIVKRLMHQHDVKVQNIEPVIVTGLEALGRGHDLTRLRGFLSDITALAEVRPEVLMRLDENAILDQLTVGHGIERGAFLLSEEEFQEKMMQQQMAALAQQAAPGLIDKAADQMAMQQQPESEQNG